jgi:hypothetical protein
MPEQTNEKTATEIIKILNSKLLEQVEETLKTNSPGQLNVDAEKVNVICRAIGSIKII